MALVTIIAFGLCDLVEILKYFKCTEPFSSALINCTETSALIHVPRVSDLHLFFSVQASSLGFVNLVLKHHVINHKQYCWGSGGTQEKMKEKLYIGNKA